jgi:hypothetical protein
VDIYDYSKINIRVKYRVFALLPRTEEDLLVFEDTELDSAQKYCEKNIKYFPRLNLLHGAKGFPGYKEDVFENDEFKDRSRDHVNDAKIGRIKRKTRFETRIISETDSKVCFLVRYKKNQARVCIIDKDNKDKVFALLKTKYDCYRIKIHRGALPLVYYRNNAVNHTTLVELLFDKKKFGFMNFRDGNPYNYMMSNIFFTKVSQTRNRKKPSTGYYGVLYLPNEVGNKKYVANVYVNGRCKKVGRFSDPLIAAKSYDRARMELYGRSAAKNFPYEYYAAFEPHYVTNVS